MFSFALALACLIGSIVCSPATETISLLNLEECEGKDAANYTLIASADGPSEAADLVQCSANGLRAVNSLRALAASKYPAGAYKQDETLFLVTAGPLQGKYIFIKTIRLSDSYLKKRSSVMGYSYVTSKSSQLLINNNLDLNVLISPNGGYELFKKGCNTVCNGRQITV